MYSEYGTSSFAAMLMASDYEISKRWRVGRRNVAIQEQKVVAEVKLEVLPERIRLHNVGMSAAAHVVTRMVWNRQ